jgi:hypothetical protein
VVCYNGFTYERKLTMKKIKAYKATDMNMQCNGFQYEMNKVIEHKYENDEDGNKIPLMCCYNGFHACEQLKDVMFYYPDTENTRYFEVEILGKIERKYDKLTTDKIIFIRELDQTSELFTNNIDILIYQMKSKIKNGYQFNTQQDRKWLFKIADGIGFSFNRLTDVIKVWERNVGKFPLNFINILFFNSFLNIKDKLGTLDTWFIYYFMKEFYVHYEWVSKNNIDMWNCFLLQMVQKCDKIKYAKPIKIKMM